MFCLSCGDIYLSFDISLLTTFECDSLAGFLILGISADVIIGAVIIGALVIIGAK